MLKVALPRPSSDAVIRGDGRAAFRPYDDFDEQEAPVKPLTRLEAEALASRQPTLSPWKVVTAQVAVGMVLAMLVLAVTSDRLLAVSALYGAAVVAIPGALMARGTTSPLATLSPLSGTVSLFAWAMVKIAVSVAMLAMAPRVVPGVSWPMLLASLVVCMQTYAFALLWRVRTK